MFKLFKYKAKFKEPKKTTNKYSSNAYRAFLYYATAYKIYVTKKTQKTFQHLQYTHFNIFRLDTTCWKFL